MDKKAGGVGGAATAALPMGASALKTLVTMGLVGVPTLAAYLGYTQSKAKDSIEADKDFEVRKRKIGTLNDGIDALS